MSNFKLLNNITGWLVFAIATFVYYFSVEPTGSLWDCGEFVSGAYKLQVVHPPGAPLFLLIGRVFTMIAGMLSSNPETIAFSVNLMSGVATAFGAMFVCWTAIIFGKLCLVGRESETNASQNIALMATGLVAGLAMAFSTSVWFSAVEGEVYALSTFFTCLTIWAIIKWYNLPNDPQNDRWVMFAIYSAALSTGVHLLSLLTFPALALFYYFKKYKEHTFKGVVLASLAGLAIIVGTQSLVITGIPKLWYYMELLMVNTFGLPVQSGIFPTLLILGGAIFYGLRYASKHNNGLIQRIVLGYALAVIGFSTIGVVVIRANANTPINMNNPSDPMSLLPYLNREQYGERPLLRGPHFDAKPTGTDMEDRYGRVGDHYEVTGRKVDYTFSDADKMLFPRIGHYEQGRPQQHRLWMDGKKGVPTQTDNLRFFFRYQLGWMYWRYFMWNFVGRQNGDQGYYPWDKTSGHWISGIDAIDNSRLYNQGQLPPAMKNNQARNTYFFLPLLFGLLGVFYHLRKRREDFIGLLGVFVITGIGIIIYSNQPPNEPRERDYVLVGSFLTFCIWIGMGVLAVYDLLSEKLRLGAVAAPVAGLLALSAPVIMGFQNFDDHSRRDHYGSRDYASNFLNSVAKDAIIFTYGDNDTYPLWYAQEVEGIRPDVRVVNLSLIAVDWYIEQLRRKVNESPTIKLSIPTSAYRGFKRDQVPVYTPAGSPREMNILDAVKFLGEDHPVAAGGGMSFETYLPTTSFFMNVDVNKVKSNGTVSAADSVVSRMDFSFGDKSSILKDDLAVMDIVASNAFDRPIYWAVTCQANKLLGLQDYLRLEGLALRLVPVKSQSEQQMFGIIGSGGVDTESIKDKFLNKYKWGNFDNHKTYVDRSYLPSVQSHKLVLARAIQKCIEKGDKKGAADLADKYFKAFPMMNFPYDYNSLFLLTAYVQADAFDRAKPHIQELAQELADYLKFASSLDPSDLKAGFESDYQMSMQNADRLINMAEDAKDEALVKELKDKFAPFGLPLKAEKGS